MTTKRALCHFLALFLACAGFWAAVPGSASAQERVRIHIRNASTGPLTIRVYDDVCRQTAFVGTLNSRAQRPINLCPDRRSRGQITVIDRFGEQRSYRIRQGQVLSLRARYGSGGLGR